MWEFAVWDVELATYFLEVGLKVFESADEVYKEAAVTIGDPVCLGHEHFGGVVVAWVLFLVGEFDPVEEGDC